MADYEVEVLAGDGAAIVLDVEGKNDVEVEIASLVSIETLTEVSTLEITFPGPIVVNQGDQIAGIGVSDVSETYIQAVPADTWTIAHSLPYAPNVTVIDSSGRKVEGDVSYPDNSTVVIHFTSAGVPAGFAGKAYLS